MCVSKALRNDVSGPTGGLKAPPRPPALREKTTFGFFRPHHQNPLGTLISCGVDISEVPGCHLLRQMNSQ